MIGRILRVATLVLGVALVLPAASGSLPIDQSFHSKQAKRLLATCTGGPAACADLAVRQGDVPDPVPAGDGITYKIVLQNHGPDAAPCVRLTDTLPPGVDFDSVETNVDSPPPTPCGEVAAPSPPCSQVEGTVSCDFGTVENTDLNGPPAVGPRVINIHVHYDVGPNQVNPPPDYPRTITNTVSVTSQADDENASNNLAQENTTILSPGDLAITKTHPPATTNLAAASNVGDTVVKVQSVQDLATGQALQIDTTGTMETVTITAVGTRGATGSGVKFTPALASAHASGATVVEPGVEETEAPANTFVYSLKLHNIARATTLDPAPPDGSGTIADPITVTDTLPHGFAFVGSQSNLDNCTATPAGVLESSTVTCHPHVRIQGTGIPEEPAAGSGYPPDHYAGVPGGDSYTLGLLVQPIASSRGIFTNTATVSKYGGDPTPGDDFASDQTKVQCPEPGTRRVPGLCITKSDSQDPVPQGAVFSYTLSVTNERTGSEDAFTDNVQVTDQIPTGMTVQSTTVENGSCGPVSSGGLLTCTLKADILPGSTRHITVNLIALTVGTFDNLACVEAKPRVCAIETTTIIPAADLAITKSGPTVPVDVNSPVTYTITVTNKGPAPVPHVQMQDSIPVGETFDSFAPASEDCSLTSPTNFHCDLGTMAPLQVKVITVVATPTVEGDLSNTATVANDGTPTAPFDFDLTNNSATFVINARTADLSLTKTATPEPVGVGQPLTYTLVVTNKGPGVASGVKLVDTLPNAVASPHVNASQGTCTGTSTITCDIGTMQATDVVTVTIQVNPITPGTAKNTATVSSSVSFDPDLTNNTASATSTITAADVTISKSAGPDPVAIGITLTYTLHVTNLGPNRATGVTVRDTLPDAVALPTATPSQGTCFGSPTITCVLGDMPANFVATITIVVTPIAATPTLTNTANVSSAFDLNSANNSASVTTRVIEPDLEVTPDLGNAGFVPFAIGTDFPPNSPLQLSWRPGLGKKIVTTDATGSFRVPMLVLPHDVQGPRQLVATSLQSQVPATAFLDSFSRRNFLVVPSSSQPFQVKPAFPTTKLVERGG